VVEPRFVDSHVTRCTVKGLPLGAYRFKVADQERQRLVVIDETAVILEIEMEGQAPQACRLIRL
jgi:hypothetical protein